MTTDDPCEHPARSLGDGLPILPLRVVLHSCHVLFKEEKEGEGLALQQRSHTIGTTANESPAKLKMPNENHATVS